MDGALREAWEEAGVPRENVELLFTSVFDVGYWRYTTVVVSAAEPFEAVISDPESLALEWVPPEGVDRRPLHCVCQPSAAGRSSSATTKSDSGVRGCSCHVAKRPEAVSPEFSTSRKNSAKS